MIWLDAILWLGFIAAMFAVIRRVDKLWYFHKHGDNKEAEEFRKYIGE